MKKRTREKDKSNRLLNILGKVCPECDSDLEERFYHNRKFLYCSQCEKIKYVYN